MEEYSEKNIKELENQLLSKIGYFSPEKRMRFSMKKSIAIFILSNFSMS